MRWWTTLKEEWVKSRQDHVQIQEMIQASERTILRDLQERIAMSAELNRRDHERQMESQAQLTQALNLTVTELQRLHEWAAKFDQDSEAAGVYAMSDAKAAQVEKDLVRTQAGKTYQRPPRGLVR